MIKKNRKILKIHRSVFPEISKRLLNMFNTLKVEIGLYNGSYLILEIPYWFACIIFYQIAVKII